MAKQHMTIPIFVPHMGCPHRCIFCNQWSTSGAKAMPDSESLRGTVEEYRSTARPGQDIELAFFGGSFTAIKRELQVKLLAAASDEKKRGRIKRIRLSTRPDCVSPEALDLLESYGADIVELGAQSFHDDVLNAAERGHTAQDTIDAASLIRSRGMGLVIQLMPGLPHDTDEKSLSSARQAADLSPEAVRIYPSVVIKGTGLARLWQRGEYRPLSLDRAVDLCAAMHEIFAVKDIPVIRTGLHPLSSEEEKAVLAGPYHPALGFMVKARIKRGRMEKALREFTAGMNIAPGSRITAHLPRMGIEEYIGHRRENIRYLASIAGCAIDHAISERDSVLFTVDQ